MNLTTKQHSKFNMIESMIDIEKTINSHYEFLESVNENFSLCLKEGFGCDELTKTYNNFRLFALTMIKAYEYLKKRDIKNMKKCFKLLKDARNKILEKVEDLKTNFDDESYLHMLNSLMENYKCFQEFQKSIEYIDSMSS